MSNQSWFGHYIRKNHANSRPQTFVFVDVETRQTEIGGTKPYVKHELELGVACAVTWKKGRQQKEEWYDFEYAAHFWGWLGQWQSKKKVLWVVAHNAQFDFTILGLWKHIENGYYATKRAGRTYTDSRTGESRMSEPWNGLLAIEGCPFQVETEGPRGRVNFSDLQNYYQCSLAEIGRTVGLAKGSWDDVKEDRTSLREYCKNDVEILRLAYLGLVEKWEKENNGNWQFSAAGLAYSNFRHCHMAEQIAIHSHANAMSLEWDSLYGGEVRCWFRGKVNRPLVHYDVNSLYPSVMRDEVYPTALVDVAYNPSVDYAASLIDRFACVAEVDIETADSVYPLRVCGKITFPIGKFRTTLAGPEILAAVDGRDIKHFHAIALYTHGSIFKGYVLRWWAEKQIAQRNRDKAAEKFAKLMLNSLPAKFAQRTPVWEADANVDVVRPWKSFPWRDPKTGVMYSARSVGWVGQVMRHRVPTEHSFPAIYAYVTAYARERMRFLRSFVPSGNLYYQDTDSLIVSRECVDAGSIPADLIGDGLGQLRIVGEYDWAEFRGPKNYTLPDRHVISGVRQRDQMVAPMVWAGTRFERTSALFRRDPDSTLREHSVNIDTPGCESEGGCGTDGWTIPVKLA